MKRLLLTLLLLCAALAVEVDPETGCEMYSDHLVCPQVTDVEVEMTYATDADCYSLQNEGGELEELGCFAEADIASLEYESCLMYIPFDDDLNIGEIDYEYECATEKLDNERVTTIGFMDQYTGCETLNETEFYGEYSCPLAGKKVRVAGTIEYSDGDYSLLVVGQEDAEFAPLAGVSSAIVALAVAVLLVYALYLWSEKK